MSLVARDPSSLVATAFVRAEFVGLLEVHSHLLNENMVTRRVKNTA